MIGKKAEEALNRAVRYAYERRQEYFTLEHVLLSLLEDPVVIEVVEALSADQVEMKKDLSDYLDKEIPEMVKKPEQATEDEDEEQLSEHPVATLSIQRMIQRALIHVQSSGKNEIQPEDLFVAIFQAKDSYALHILQKNKLQRLEVLEYLSHGRLKDEEGDFQGEDGLKSRRGPKIDSYEALDKFTVNLNQLARQGKIDPLIGRSQELERVVQVLCRRQKNNPLLVGEAGVGKTAITEGLALRIIQGEVPKILEKTEIYSLDMGSLLAGTKFRGDFEHRLKKIIKDLEKKKQNGVDPVLMVDEIHTLIGAGSVSGGHMDAANLIKPMLSRGELRCIGSTTYQEYRTIFEKDHALARRFQKIDVVEPSKDEAVQILKGLKPQYEAHHNVQYEDEAIRAAVELSSRHISDRFLPDKAIDIIDEAGAKAHITSFGKESQEKIKISEEDIEEIVSKLARIPPRSISSNQKKRLKNLENDLKLTIYGQDFAVTQIVSAIRLARSGLRSGDKPIGSFLFCGPTGVGKTELTKQLAHSLGVPFLRYDMSEYMEKHTVSRLIGAPPGYVGFDQAGLLTDAVLKNPHSVVLLDEIEKAHIDIMNILLQVMDHGMLTDHNGRKVDFKNTIVIMTSNVGSREQEKRKMGFTSGFAGNEAAKKEVEKYFSPEFRNRLDAIIYFSPLSRDTVMQVVNKHILELESQLLQKAIELEVDQDVKDYLCEKGYDPKMGARPLARLLQDEIKRPLSEEILFGSLEKGGRVEITMNKNNKIDFKYHPTKKKHDKKTIKQSE